jgi:hypothetical protein
MFVGGNMWKNDFVIGLTNNKNILKQFVSIISENDIHKRIKDFWTIYEHIDHLVVTQKMLLGRIQQFIVEDNPIMKPYIPEDNPTVEDAKKSAKELVEEFIKLRDLQIGLMKKAKRSVWQKVGVHPEYSKYSLEILVRHILLHDSFHMWRMEELWIEKENLIQELK